MDLLECTVRVSYGSDNTAMEVYKGGKTAITPAEAMVLMALHSIGDEDNGLMLPALQNVKKVGTAEVNRSQLMHHLTRTYGRKIVQELFPRPNLMPNSIKDLDLPADCLAKPTVTQQEQLAERQKVQEVEALRKQITDAGKTIPQGELSADDLRALIEEYGLEAA